MTVNDNVETEDVVERWQLLGIDPDTLREWLVAEGQQKFRARQVMEWIYEQGAGSFDQMTNLSKELRAWLAERADVARATITADSTARDGTRKLLMTWPDEAAVETVWIPESERNTVCVSSQVGCPVGCPFCASGLKGVQRNLTAAEIVEQAWRVGRMIRESDSDEGGGARLTNVVLMGMGEPLANYEAVLEAVRIINAPWGLNIGARKITLSTVGVPQQIRRLAEEGLQLNLALSLHAVDLGLRARLIPWGRMSLTEVLDACAYYFEKTGREITLEYVLLDEVNMSQRDIAQLAKVAGKLRCNVNLIRYNPVPGVPFGRPSSEASYVFQRDLRKLGVNAHIRTSRGQDIDAACGQLRRRVEG